MIFSPHDIQNGNEDVMRCYEISPDEKKSILLNKKEVLFELI